MSHELTIMENGKAMMAYDGKQPWHMLGQESENPMTVQSALELSYTDFPLLEVPLGTVSERQIDGIPIIGQNVSTHKAIVNGSNNSILGIVGADYQPVPNKELIEYIDALIGEGNLEYHTIGSLFDGRQFFVSAKIPQSFLDELGVQNFDNTEKYILLASGHDGSMAIHFKWTEVRVVCRNTLSAALGTWIDGKSKVKPQSDFKIKHTKNYQDKIVQARQALQLYGIYQKMLDKVMDKLVNTPFVESDMDVMVKTLMPSSKDKVSKRTIDRRNKVMELFTGGAGHDAIENTAYAGLQAVTEYVDHHSGTRNTGKDEDEANFSRIIWGSGATMKQKAVDYLGKTIADDSFRKEVTLIGA